MRAIIVALALALSNGAALAQESKDCPAGMAQPATPPEPGDATAPGNAATGWSGGLGGSQTGTSPSGAQAASKTWQPPTARGLDLVGEPEAAAC